METIYKVTTTYRTDRGEFTEQYVGTLTDCLRASENHGRGQKILQIKSDYEPLVLNVTDKFLSIFNNK